MAVSMLVLGEGAVITGCDMLPLERLCSSWPCCAPGLCLWVLGLEREGSVTYRRAAVERVVSLQLDVVAPGPGHRPHTGQGSSQGASVSEG